MKKYLFYAVALAAFASCVSESYDGTEDERRIVKGDTPISFGFDVPTATRAQNAGAEAAAALGNQFIVWGEKNESDGTAATAEKLVFKNYKVEWTDNSAYKTTSNTKNWEYVGLTPYADTKVSPAISGTQTIKYWDYNASSYTFTAVSALQSDIADGKVVIAKTTSGTTVYDKGYEITVKTGASLDKLYVADRNQPTTGTGTDRTAENTYGGNVTMKFRNFMSKIRFGLYETIPGYKVSITNVEYNSTGSTTTNKFGVDGKFLAVGDGSSTNTVFTVTYETGTNKAIAGVKSGTTPNSTSYLETAQSVAGSPILSSSAANPISTSPATPTFDKTDGAYTTILPFTTNDTNIKVKFDFTLTSEDTGETISVVDATAEIPADYCKWISNYAYTYILKLNDNTNGQIGGVTGLYPITFDAVQIIDENGKAEYITTVSEPSITTFAVKSGAYQTGGSDYTNGSDVYATIVDNNAVVDPTGKYNVYSVSGTGITEASVAESLAEVSAKTHNVTCTPYAGTKTLVTTVPREDGGTITLTTGKAIKLESLAAGTYAVEYVKTARTLSAQEVTYPTLAAFTSALSAVNLYSDSGCTTPAAAADYGDATTKFYKQVVTNVGTYAYKVIVVN